LLNGQADGDLALSRGLHYGDGVFRTVLIWDAQLIDWDQHLEKLSSDCAALDLDVPDLSQLAAEAMQLAAGQARAVLKVIVMRQAGGRGYRADARAADRLLLSYPAPKFETRCWESGVNAFSPVLRLSLQPALAGLKHLNRLEQVLASRDWPENADEGILCNQAGYLVSGTRSNLFWVTSGKLHTPLLDESGVSGMMRNKIIMLGKTMQVATSVVKAPLSALQEADEAFVCNSLIGIWPLRRFEGREWQAPGEITQKLAKALQHPRLV
jgi:4-amino-4-deoxychorismate lyase